MAVTGVLPGNINLYVLPNGKKASFPVQANSISPANLIQVQTLASGLLTPVAGGQTITINGSGFGTKATARQYFFQNFVGVAEGASASVAGFDCYVDRGAEKITHADGVFGGGSLRCDPGTGGANGAFPYLGIYLPNGNQKVRASLWFRVYGNGVDDTPFAKIFRCGKRIGSDPAASYGSTQAKFYPKMGIYTPGRIGDWSFQAAFRSASGEVGAFPPSQAIFGNVPHPPEPSISLQNWMYLEGLLKLNDIGSNNARIRMISNTYTQIDANQFAIKTTADEDLSFIMPVVEVESAFNNYDYAMAHYCIDVGPDCEAKIELINASSTAAMTAGPIELEISSWSNTSVSAYLPSVIPSGYNWARITSRTGSEQVFTR